MKMEVNIDELLKKKSNTCRTNCMPKTIVHNECGGACCFCYNKLPMSLYTFIQSNIKASWPLQMYIYIFSCVRHTQPFCFIYIHLLIMSCKHNWMESPFTCPVLSYFTRKLLLILSLTELLLLLLLLWK